jgi:radical SAM-linked protein
MNVRLKFRKGWEVKYISHLDLMRTFQRAIRRAEVPISYSSGFNPHQELSFGAPLSLGITSDAEYVDIKLAERISVDELINKLNSTLPEGIKVLKGMEIAENSKSAMSVVSHAYYRITMTIEEIDGSVLGKSIEDFLKQDRILVMKEQPKKGFKLKEIDIRPMIVRMELTEAKENEYSIRCLLSSGSKANLKPELLMTAFREFTGYDLKRIRINREEIYAEKNGRLVDLLEYGIF